MRHRIDLLIHTRIDRPILLLQSLHLLLQLINRILLVLQFLPETELETFTLYFPNGIYHPAPHV